MVKLKRGKNFKLITLLQVEVKFGKLWKIIINFNKRV